MKELIVLDVGTRTVCLCAKQQLFRQQEIAEYWAVQPQVQEEIDELQEMNCEEIFNTQCHRTN